MSKNQQQMTSALVYILLLMSETRLDTFVIGEVRRELGQFFCKLTSHASFLRGFPRFSQQLSFQKYTTFAPFLYSLQDLLS